MRHAHSILLCSLAFFAGMSTLPGIAAEAVTTNASAPASASASPAVLDPAAPSAPLHHSALPPSGNIVAQPGDWKAANAAVAQFPRGHADVLKWEKAQSTAPSQATPAPNHQHHQHGGQPWSASPFASRRC